MFNHFLTSKYRVVTHHYSTYLSNHSIVYKPQYKSRFSFFWKDCFGGKSYPFKYEEALRLCAAHKRSCKEPVHIEYTIDQISKSQQGDNL